MKFVTVVRREVRGIGEISVREKQSHSVQRSGAKRVRIEDGRVAGARLFLESRVLGPLMWYFIGHNPPFMGRPFVLEE